MIPQNYDNVLRNILVPRILEEYWKTAWDHRDASLLWNENAIFFDLFKIWAVPSAPKAREGKGGLICVVPSPRPFWDCIIAKYILETPGFEENGHALACSRLLENLARFIGKKELVLEGLGEFFKNFDGNHLLYLIESRDGLRSNTFLDDPFFATCHMKTLIFLAGLPSSGHPDWQKRRSIKQIYEETCEQFAEIGWPEAVPGWEQFSKEMFRITDVGQGTIDDPGLGGDSSQELRGSDAGDGHIDDPR